MRLGIVGGIGPESTIDYYRMFIKMHQGITKDGSYPEVIINCIDMNKMLGMVGANNWQGLVDYLAQAVNQLASAGATYGLLASNTPHVVFEEVQARCQIPLLSIVEETCKKAKGMGLGRIGLLGTGFTMKSDYYKTVFEREGITVFIPNPEEQEYIHSKIFSELQNLIIKDETKEGLLSIVKRMSQDQGIEGVILGCTELPLILTEDELGIKFINTSQVHMESAIEYGLVGAEMA